jgi:hypothetical protein
MPQVQEHAALHVKDAFDRKNGYYLTTISRADPHLLTFAERQDYLNKLLEPDDGSFQSVIDRLKKKNEENDLIRYSACQKQELEDIVNALQHTHDILHQDTATFKFFWCYTSISEQDYKKYTYSADKQAILNNYSDYIQAVREAIKTEITEALESLPSDYDLAKDLLKDANYKDEQFSFLARKRYIDAGTLLELTKICSSEQHLSKILTIALTNYRLQMLNRLIPILDFSRLYQDWVANFTSSDPSAIQEGNFHKKLSKVFEYLERFPKSESYVRSSYLNKKFPNFYVFAKEVIKRIEQQNGSLDALVAELQQEMSAFEPDEQIRLQGCELIRQVKKHLEHDGNGKSEIRLAMVVNTRDFQSNNINIKPPGNPCYSHGVPSHHYSFAQDSVIFSSNKEVNPHHLDLWEVHLSSGGGRKVSLLNYLEHKLADHLFNPEQKVVNRFSDTDVKHTLTTHVALANHLAHLYPDSQDPQLAAQYQVEFPIPACEDGTIYRNGYVVLRFAARVDKLVNDIGQLQEANFYFIIVGKTNTDKGLDHLLASEKVFLVSDTDRQEQLNQLSALAQKSPDWESPAKSVLKISQQDGQLWAFIHCIAVPVAPDTTEEITYKGQGQGSVQNANTGPSFFALTKLSTSSTPLQAGSIAIADIVPISPHKDATLNTRFNANSFASNIKFDSLEETSYCTNSATEAVDDLSLNIGAASSAADNTNPKFGASAASIPAQHICSALEPPTDTRVHIRSRVEVLSTKSSACMSGNTSNVPYRIVSVNVNLLAPLPLTKRAILHTAPESAKEIAQVMKQCESERVCPNIPVSISDPDWKPTHDQPSVFSQLEEYTSFEERRFTFYQAKKDSNSNADISNPPFTSQKLGFQLG